MLPEVSLDVSLWLRDGVGERVLPRSRVVLGRLLLPRLWARSVVLCARGRERCEVEPCADGNGVLPGGPCEGYGVE